jgi:hypothetical protein
MQQQDRREADHITGIELPSGDGDVGQEQVNAVGNEAGGAGGQDHSTDIDEERRDPTEGVGAVQDSSDTGAGVADISD